MRPTKTCILVMTAIVVLTLGCVRRTLKINTTPDEARVYVNDREIGTSPCEIDFVYYGDYDVVIRKDGYVTLKTHWQVSAPWYQLPVVDLVSEALVPGEIHDVHERTFELTAAEEIDRDELIEEARALRHRAVYTDD